MTPQAWREQWASLDEALRKRDRVPLPKELLRDVPPDVFQVFAFEDPPLTISGSSLGYLPFLAWDQNREVGIEKISVDPFVAEPAVYKVRFLAADGKCASVNVETCAQACSALLSYITAVEEHRPSPLPVVPLEWRAAPQRWHAAYRAEIARVFPDDNADAGR